MPASDEQRALLRRLFDARNWLDLADQATELGEQFPDDAEVCAYAAHALRQQGLLQSGYEWAMRGLAADPGNLFALNRASLLANLNHDYQTAWTAATVAVALPFPETDETKLNLAVTLVNGIHAAAKLGTIADAVALFGAVIDQLNHKELHFNTAAMYALAGDRTRALQFAGRALATGKPRLAFLDQDFHAVRGDAEFQQLLARDWIAEAAAFGRAAKRLKPVIANPYGGYNYNYQEGFTPPDDQDGDRGVLIPEDFIDHDELHMAPFQPVDHARSPELEAAIVREPDEPGNYQVYADWFLEREDLRGQLILASLQCALATNESERMLAYAAWGALVGANARRWMGPLVELLRYNSSVRWRSGFISELVFEIGTRRRPGDSAEDLLASILELPTCRLLRSLEVRDIYLRSGELDYNAVIELLVTRCAHLPLLTSLAFVPNAVNTGRADLTPLVLAIARLDSIVVGGTYITLGPIHQHAATLRRLAVHATDLTHEIAAPVLDHVWPHLDELEVWFGQHATIGHVQLVPVFSSVTAPALRRLRVRNTNFGNQLLSSLLSSPLLPRLTLLDLTANQIDEAGGQILRNNSARFRHLERLVLDHNNLPAAFVAQLKMLLPNATFEPQGTGEIDDAYYDDVDE
ncbi:MAG: hypothetical protein QM831_30820 [Kofleriaceae bacterium]